MRGLRSTRAARFTAFLLIPAAIIVVAVVTPSRPPSPPRVVHAEVVIYGATAAGVVAAVSAARLGADVVLVSSDSHVGGMVTSGLGATDVGIRALVGGITREFYARVDDIYKSRRVAVPFPWYHEPHVASRVFSDMLAEAGVRVVLGGALDRAGVRRDAEGWIRSIHLQPGTDVIAEEFIDATYEGDLLAAAGVPYVVGREAADKYGESLAGVRPVVPAATAAERILGRSSTGDVLPGVSPEGPQQPGSADGLVQPYTFRLCVTNVPANRVSWTPPPDYRRSSYALLERTLEVELEAAGSVSVTSVASITPLPREKADLNNSGLVSTDLVGPLSATWADADDAHRREIFDIHRRYEQGLLYFLATDDAVPEPLRREISAWGLCRDEFQETGGWPPELYVREARRMVGDFVMTQQDVQTDITKPDPIAVGTYRIDGHFVQRVLDASGYVRPEGELFAKTEPYEIPYRAVIPPSGTTRNLLVACAVSASHVAFASLRMEVNYMAMGEAAGVAAVLAARGDTPVAAVPYPSIADILKSRGGILSVN